MFHTHADLVYWQKLDLTSVEVIVNTWLLVCRSVIFGQMYNYFCPWFSRPELSSASINFTPLGLVASCIVPNRSLRRKSPTPFDLPSTLHPPFSH